MIVRGELEEFLAHARQRLIQRQPVEVTQGHRDVSVMSKLRRRNRPSLKRLDQSCDFRVARKLFRLQFNRPQRLRMHPPPNKEERDGTNDRHDESGSVKGRAGRGFGEHAPDQATDDRTADAKDRGHDETEMLHAGHDRAGAETDDETDNDRPDDV